MLTGGGDLNSIGADDLAALVTSDSDRLGASLAAGRGGGGLLGLGSVGVLALRLLRIGSFSACGDLHIIGTFYVGNISNGIAVFVLCCIGKAFCKGGSNEKCIVCRIDNIRAAIDLYSGLRANSIIRCLDVVLATVQN